MGAKARLKTAELLLDFKSGTKLQILISDLKLLPAPWTF